LAQQEDLSQIALLSLASLSWLLVAVSLSFIMTSPRLLCLWPQCTSFSWSPSLFTALFVSVWSRFPSLSWS